MILHFYSVFTLLIVLIAAMVAVYLDWITGSEMITVAVSGVTLTGLLGILKLPWDLYFDSKNLLAEQQESLENEIDIRQEDIHYTAKMSRRLFLLCIGAHLVSALVIAAATYYSGGNLGYYFAGFFLLSTTFRPGWAFYLAQRRRFAMLRSRTYVPRQDATQLAMRIDTLESNLMQLTEEIRYNAEQVNDKLGKLQLDQNQIAEDHRQMNKKYYQKVEMICDEFEKSISKLNHDKELLSGMKAFIKMIKTT